MASDMPSLRDLFDAARELSGEARERFVAGLEPAQRAYLQRLLDAADIVTGEGALKVDAASLVAALDEPPAPALPVSGQHVGPWQLIALIGEGGSSTVFRAAREHAGVRQEAALKLLRRGLYTLEAQRAFRRERQALTQLSHPDIARLIEGGVTDNGLAYIVLDYVDGVPITDYVRSHTLDLRARLRLFLRVCRAVDAAHRALIVHRDLKPSNVLVTGAGDVKLLDFGIAKLLDADDETQTKLPAFTPAYAAPEQRSGALITTATDVYALGVLLGELITGHRLNTGANRTPSGHVDEHSGAGVLPAPPKVTRRQLRGDLDNIVLKAITEEPARRYASAGAFADEIERLLDGRPVVAHPPSRWYRTRKFVQRHRGGVAITALFLLAIFASLGLALWQAGVAREEAQRAREVQTFIEDLFEPLAYNIAEDHPLTVQEAFRQGFDRAVTSFPNEPRLRADLTALFARLDRRFDNSAATRDLSEHAYRINVQAYGEANVQTLAARHGYALALQDAGNFRAAEALLQDGVDIARRAGMHGTMPGALLDALAMARTRLGIKETELLPLVREAIAEYQGDARTRPHELSNAYSHLGVIYHNMNAYDDALIWYGKAIAIDREPSKENFSYANDLLRIGGTHYWIGRWREAYAEHQEALAMFGRLAAKNNATRAALLTYLCDEAVALELREAAAHHCDVGLDEARANFGENHPQFATALIRHAAALVLAGNIEAGAAELARARAILAKAEGDQGRIIKAALLAEAALDYAHHDHAGLRERLRTLIGPGERGNQRAPRAFAWFALACAQAPGDGCPPDIANQADAVLADPRFARSPYQLPAQIALAEIELAGNRPQAAIERVEKGMAIATPEIGTGHSWIGQAHTILSRAQAALGNGEHSREQAQQADAIVSAQPPGHALRLWVNGESKK